MKVIKLFFKVINTLALTFTLIAIFIMVVSDSQRTSTTKKHNPIDTVAQIIKIKKILYDDSVVAAIRPLNEKKKQQMREYTQQIYQLTFNNQTQSTAYKYQKPVVLPKNFVAYIDIQNTSKMPLLVCDSITDIPQININPELKIKKGKHRK